MKKPLQITFRNMAKSVTLSSLITQQVSRLEKIFPDLISCNVTLELPSTDYTGKLYYLCIHLKTSGAEFDVVRSERDNAFLAVQDAFSVAKRGLENCMNLVSQPK